jgi:hypothetical protein
MLLSIVIYFKNCTCVGEFRGREVELLAKVKAKYCEKLEPEVITRVAQLRALDDEHHSDDSDDSDDGYFDPKFDGTDSPQRFINRAVVATMADETESVPHEDAEPSVDAATAAAPARSKKWDSKAAMKDGTAASILLTSELENLLADIRVGWESSFKLRNFSTGHVLGWG